MQIATTVIRMLLGLLMVLVPLFSFLNKTYQPKLHERGQRLMTALGETGYLLTFVQVTELVAGLLLLTGCFVPLALLALVPVTLNILLFHLFLAPPAGFALGIFLMHAFLLWMHRSAYTQLMQPFP